MTTTTQKQPIEGEIIREIELKIDGRTASIQILPKPDELNDTKMPRNLHNAAELFLRAGMVEAAEAVRDCSRALLDLYADDPDGRKAVRVGKGCVCWGCGFCGLPVGESVEEGMEPGPCAGCGEVEQVNWLRVTKGGGGKDGAGGEEGELPWIEEPPMSEEEKEKKREAGLAAKRAEVEAKVKQAVEERDRKQVGEEGKSL